MQYRATENPNFSTLRDYVVTIGAGESVTLNVEGGFYCVYKCTGEISLSFGNARTVKRSQFDRGSCSYTSVTVSSPITQTITIMLGFGFFESGTVLI